MFSALSAQDSRQPDGGERVSRRGARRDREFRRYKNPSHIEFLEKLLITSYRYAEAVAGLRHRVSGQVAVSSRDSALTAYAQLVALRLNAKRALVSLFDKESMHILAEATRTLSLQRDVNPADAMWFGAAILDRDEQDFHRMTLKANKRAVRDCTTTRRYFEVKDLLQDPRYAQHRFVVNEPFARAYAGVPMMSPNGYAIGTVSFLDDKVREVGISEHEVSGVS